MIFLGPILWRTMLDNHSTYVYIYNIYVCVYYIVVINPIEIGVISTVKSVLPWHSYDKKQLLNVVNNFPINNIVGILLVLPFYH